MAFQWCCTYVEGGKVCGRRCIKGRLICFKHDLRLTIHGEVEAERARVRREEVEPLMEALRKAEADLRYLVGPCPVGLEVALLRHLSAALRAADERGK